MGMGEGSSCQHPDANRQPRVVGLISVGSLLPTHFALGFLEEKGVNSFFQDKREVGGWFLQTRVTTWHNSGRKDEKSVVVAEMGTQELGQKQMLGKARRH